MSGAATANFHRHTSDYRPGGDVSRVASGTNAPLSIGLATWVNLPASWGQAIVDSGGGIGISGADYVVLEGVSTFAESGLLALDWTRP